MDNTTDQSTNRAAIREMHPEQVEDDYCRDKFTPHPDGMTYTCQRRKHEDPDCRHEWDGVLDQAQVTVWWRRR